MVHPVVCLYSRPYSEQEVGLPGPFQAVLACGPMILFLYRLIVASFLSVFLLPHLCLYLYVCFSFGVFIWYHFISLSKVR